MGASFFSFFFFIFYIQLKRQSIHSHKSSSLAATQRQKKEERDRKRDRKNEENCRHVDERERERKRDNDSDRKTERESLRLAGGDQIIQTHLVEFFNDFSSFNKSLFQSRSILFLVQNLKFKSRNGIAVSPSIDARITIVQFVDISRSRVLSLQNIKIKSNFYR